MILVPNHFARLKKEEAFQYHILYPSTTLYQKNNLKMEKKSKTIFKGIIEKISESINQNSLCPSHKRILANKNLYT